MTSTVTNTTAIVAIRRRRRTRSIPLLFGGGYSWWIHALLLLAAANMSRHPWPAVTAFLVRSQQGGGGIATGLAYNARDNQVVIVGTTFAAPNDDNGTVQQGECFVAIGDASHGTNNNDDGNTNKFSQLALNTPSVCFGGTSTLNHQDEGGLGVASLLGLYLKRNSNGNADTGFLHTILYYSGQVSSSAATPFDLPQGLLPVTSSVMGNAGETYIGLHPIEGDDDSDTTPFGATDAATATATPSSGLSPLSSLLRYWWSSTFPPNVVLVLKDGEKISQKPLSHHAPHVRKQDVFTGILSYDVSLEPTEGSAALIAGIAVPSSSSSSSSSTDDTATATAGANHQNQNKKGPLIVAGSTNGFSSADSLFGQAGSKSADLRDWDGYILFLDSETGAVWEDEIDGQLLQYRKPIRINSVGDADDFIQGLCLSPDQRYLYVVGTTQGILSGIHKGGAFVYQIDLLLLEDTSSSSSTASSGTTTAMENPEDAIQWRFQMSGIHVQGLACTADADAVYLGGSTESTLGGSNGTSTTTGTPTSSPDAFVTKIQAGQAQWTTFLDTTSTMQEAQPRREMIVDMEVTNRGYIMVLMNSMNLELGENDVFLLDLDPATGENDLNNNEALNSGVGGGGSGGSFTIPTFETDNDASNNNNNNEDGLDRDIVIAAIVVPVVLAVVLFGVTWWRHRTNVERLPKAIQKDHVEKDQKEADVATTIHEGVGTELV